MSTVSRKLTLDDIADVRAYERERSAVRTRLIELRRRRRLSLGSMVAISFENRETMRYQIQEMARVERWSSDAEIEAELVAYNPMVPEAGELCASLFIELTDDAGLREWLPKLVGIERAVIVRLADGSVARSEPEAGHAAQLTRLDLTPSVHFLQFRFTPNQVDAFATGPVVVAIDHPAYCEQMELQDLTVRELLADLR